MEVIGKYGGEDNNWNGNSMIAAMVRHSRIAVNTDNEEGVGHMNVSLIEIRRCRRR